MISGLLMLHLPQGVRARSPRRSLAPHAEALEESVIAATGSDRAIRARAPYLEDETRIIIEIARKTGRGPHLAEREAARFQKARAQIEPVEHGREIKPGIFGQGPDLPRDMIRLAGNGEKPLQNSFLLLAEGLRILARAIEEAARNILRRAPAHGGNAGKREQVLHEGLGLFRIGILQGIEHAGIAREALGLRLGTGERSLKLRLDAALAKREAQATRQYRREVQRLDEAREKREITHANGEPIGTDFLGHRTMHLREEIGIGGFAIAAPEGFGAELPEFGIFTGPLAEDGAEEGEIRPATHDTGFQIGQGGGNGEFRPEAQFLALIIRGDKEAAADILARQFQKRLGGLEHRHIGGRIAHAGEPREEARTQRIRAVFSQSAAREPRRAGVSPLVHLDPQTSVFDPLLPARARQGDDKFKTG